MIQWLRRRFIAGFFLTVPLIISIAALVWVFGVIDGATAPLYAELLGREVPGLGLLTTALALLAVGVVATNVFGKRLLQRVEQGLLRVPVFRTVYAPVKQLVVAFSPDNEYGFKQVVMVERADGFVLGFLTREFTADYRGQVRTLAAVYVPTNHLYLGDVFIYPREALVYPALSVEEGIRIFLTGGMAIPGRLEGREAADRRRTPGGGG